MTTDKDKVRLPGPGLPESLAWLGGVWAVQITATIVVLIVLLAGYIIMSDDVPRALQELRDPRFLDRFQAASMAWLFGGVQVLFVLAVLLATLLRLGRNFPRRLPLAPMAGRHWVLLLLMVLPLALLSGQLYQWGSQGWEQILDQWPGLQMLDDIDSMELLEAMARDVPFPVLLLILAVAPAIAEELVFRGVIGRGLVARWGLPIGVLFTSLLFAVAHVRPPHAMALIPLSIMIHVTHVATRSFWAPVMLHFLNNALAASLVKFPPPIEVPGVVGKEQPLPPLLVLTAALSVVLLGRLIWRTRVLYRQGDGQLWDPGYVTAELPPAEAGAVRQHDRPGRGLVLLCAVAVTAFAISLAWIAWAA